MELCGCPGPTPLKLMTALSSDPLHCVTCNLVVPLDRLELEDGLRDDLRRWGALVSALDYLWIDSGDYELWALHELSDVESAINRRGLALARASTETGRSTTGFSRTSRWASSTRSSGAQPAGGRCASTEARGCSGSSSAPTAGS